MDGATVEACKEMIRVIGFVLGTRDTCFKFKPNPDDKNWELVVYYDSDWAENFENCISMTGFIIYLLRVLFVGGQWDKKG
jgi:hypothetical protein